MIHEDFEGMCEELIL